MNRVLKTVALCGAFAFAMTPLLAVADNFEWESKINGIDVELKGTMSQVSNPKLQRECLKMAQYAIQQYQANGRTVTARCHEIECQIGPDGKVSALLEEDDDCASAEREKESHGGMHSPTDKPLSHGLSQPIPDLSKY